jgi:hypothetical protein
MFFSAQTAAVDGLSLGAEESALSVSAVGNGPSVSFE